MPSRSSPRPDCGRSGRRTGRSRSAGRGSRTRRRHWRTRVRPAPFVADARGCVAPKIVLLLPSTRTRTTAAEAEPTIASTSPTTTESMRVRRNTNPSFHEGFGSTGGRSSDSGLPAPPPSQRQPVAWWWGSVSPHSGGTFPGLAPGSLTRPPMSGPSLPLRCDTRPLRVAAGRRLGGLDLHAVVDPGSGDGPRRLGSRVAEDRACRRVRGARRATVAGGGQGAAGGGDRHRLRGDGRVHQVFVPGRQGAVMDVLMDAVGVLIGVYVLGRAARRVVA